MLAVNAVACAPTPRRGPGFEPRPWTEHMGSPHRAPSAAERPPTAPHLVWTARVGPAIAGGVALGDSVIAVQATDRNLSVLWRHSGERAWRARLNAQGVSAPLLTEDRVYTASGGPKGRVYAYALSDGRRAWSRQLGPIQGALAQWNDRVFAATEGGWLFALDADEGSVIWSRRIAMAVRAGVVAVSSEYLAVASDDSLHLVDPVTGRVGAAVGTAGTVFSPPAIADESVIVSSPDGFVASFHAGSLVEQWRVQTDESIFGSPAVARDTVFALTSGGTLWTIPLVLPREAAHISIGVTTRAAATPVARGVVVGTLAGEMLWVVGHEAHPRWRIELEGPVEVPVLAHRGDLVVADGRGNVQLWR